MKIEDLERDTIRELKRQRKVQYLADLWEAGRGLGSIVVASPTVEDSASLYDDVRKEMNRRWWTKRFTVEAE